MTGMLQNNFTPRPQKLNSWYMYEKEEYVLLFICLHAYLHFNCAISFCKATSDDAFLMRMAFSALRVCTSLSSDVTRCRIPWSVSAWASQHSEAEPPSGFCGRTGTNTCTIAATRRSPAIIVKNSYIHSFGSYLCYHINAILEGVIYTHWHCFDSYTTWQSYPID